MRHRKPGQRLATLLLALLFTGAGTSVLAAATPVSKGEAATIATQARPGKVERQKLTTLPSGEPVYQVAIRDAKGSVATVVVDARTGEVLNGGAMPDPAGSGPAQPGGVVAPD